MSGLAEWQSGGWSVAGFGYGAAVDARTGVLMLAPGPQLHISRAIRTLVAGACGLDPALVQPARSDVPAGGQRDVRVTVDVAGSGVRGWPERSSEADDDTDDTGTAVSQQHRRITASVNTYRTASVDPAGLALWSLDAPSLADVIPQRLLLPNLHGPMLSFGLGFLGASQSRDLTAIAGGTWESRGQVDLYFDFVNVATSPTTFLTKPGSIGLQFQQPSGQIITTDIEVPT